MKKFLFSLFLLIYISTAFSQQHVEEYTDRMDGDIWVLDSIHQYGTENEEFYLKYRDIVTSRNNRGDVTSELYLMRRNEAEDWEKNSRFTQSYYDNGKKNEYKSQLYDSKRNIWLDSFQYRKYNEKGLLIVDMSFGYNITFGYFSYGNKVYKKYNSDNKVTESKRLIWDKEKKKWVNKELRLIDYSADGNKNKLVLKSWSNESSSWINNRQEEWRYNSDSALIEYKSMVWVNNIWLNSFKKSIDYTSEGKYKIILNQGWNASEDRWENMFDNVYKYDGDSMISVWHQQWIAKDNKWKDLTLEVKKYNDAKLLFDNIKYYYPLDSADELSGTRFLFYYNSEKKILKKLSKVWSDEKNAWENFSKLDYDYNDGYTVISSYWDKIKIEYIPRTFYKYVLDSQGRTVLGVRKKWNVEESKWINKAKNVREYDNYNHLLDDSYFFWNINDWIGVNRRHYFWSKYNTNNIEELTDDGFVLFPNPAGNVLNLSYDLDKSIENIKIYSMSGNQVLEISSPAYEKIDISKLVNGVYILKINTGRGTVSKLFSVEK